jgi:hypothetical protein
VIYKEFIAVAHFFIPAGEDKSAYGQTSDGGYLHAWKLTVTVGEEGGGKIGLYGGYDYQKAPLKLSSNNPGVIEWDEAAVPGLADRIIRVVGKRPGFTILDAGDGGRPWCSLQVEVLPRLHTPNIPEWKFYRMSYDYYKLVAAEKMSTYSYCKKWTLTQAEYVTFISLFARSKFNRQYWDNIDDPPQTISTFTKDFLVIGVGGITTWDSNYGDVVLGLKLNSIQARSGIGSIAGAIARIFTDDPDIIGVIESSGDLIEIGLSGFAVARSNNQSYASPSRIYKYPTRTIQQKRLVGNMFRDAVAEKVRELHEGTGYTVDTEVEFETEKGSRWGDVVLRDPSGKIVFVMECKTGLGKSVKKQVVKDRELYLDKDIRTIKVTEDFFFVPE